MSVLAEEEKNYPLLLLVYRKKNANMKIKHVGTTAEPVHTQSCELSSPQILYYWLKLRCFWQTVNWYQKIFSSLGPGSVCALWSGHGASLFGSYISRCWPLTPGCESMSHWKVALTLLSVSWILRVWRSLDCWKLASLLAAKRWMSEVVNRVMRRRR